ncbi:MAG: hypothetical protein U9P00_10645, partial [Pseudomonadota bacterium]|nr:hypothetical protein [Pseudomonadota bacterium]
GFFTTSTTKNAKVTSEGRLTHVCERRVERTELVAGMADTHGKCLSDQAFVAFAPFVVCNTE